MESHLITLRDRLDIHVQIAGDRDAPPVLLLHGYPSSCLLWRRCIPELSRHFRVYAPDLPGHGKSGKSLDGPYDLDFLVKFIQNLYDSLGLDRAFLVAHDLGGMGALGFAAQQPGAVKKFVIMNTAPYADWPKLLRVMMRRIRNPILARLCLFSPVFKWILKSYLVARPQVITNTVAEMYRRPWTESSAARRAFRHAVLCPPEKMTVPVEMLTSIDMPTLILWGGADRVLPVGFAERLHRDLPDSDLRVVPGCGHFLQEERPDLVVRHIIDFLTAETLVGMKGAA